MVFKRVLLLCIACNLCTNVFAQSADDIDKIKEKLYILSLEGNLNVDMGSNSNIESLIISLDEAGKWNDIDYKNQSASTWDPKKHWTRLLFMARQYKNQKSPYYESFQLLNVIKRGINWWFINCPLANNYWHNAIGIPALMGPVFVLLEKNLNTEELKMGVELLQVGVKPSFYDYHGKATGQNLLWIASAHLYASCLSSDLESVKRVFREVANEILITEGEGIQADLSFYQHGPQNYTFGYGKGFALTAAQFMYLAYQTSFQFSSERVDIIARYVLDGMQWMTRGKFLEYSAMGREISRKEDNREAAILSTLNYMMVLDPERQQQYADFFRQLKGKPRIKHPEGNRYFWRSDLMIHQRKDYYFSLKATSNRIYSGESGNGENLKGWYHGNGTFYIVRRGDEYHDIFPIWKWKMIPGILCSQTSTPPPQFLWGKNSAGETSFVYGLSDSTYGCFGYDYSKDGTRAKRSWFFFDNEIINLVSNISGDSLYQSINQSWLKSGLWFDLNRVNKISKVHHDSTGYCISTSGEVYTNARKQTGSWKEINATLNDTLISREVFNVGIKLNQRSTPYFYAILPSVSLQEFKKYNLEKHIQVIQNNNSVHGVFHKKLFQVQAVFYDTGRISLPWDKLNFEIKNAGLVIIKRDKNSLIIDYHIPDQKKRVHLTVPLKEFRNEDINICKNL